MPARYARRFVRVRRWLASGPGQFLPYHGRRCREGLRRRLWVEIVGHDVSHPLSGDPKYFGDGRVYVMIQKMQGQQGDDVRFAAGHACKFNLDAARTSHDRFETRQLSNIERLAKTN